MNRSQRMAHTPRVNMLAGMISESRLVMVVSEAQYIGSLELLGKYWNGEPLPELHIAGRFAQAFPFAWRAA